MTATIEELKQRIKQRAAPLFSDENKTGGADKMPDERIPAGFVGNEETAELREKLKELLAPADLSPNQDAGAIAIANECDRRTAERLIKEDRRFTKAEAEAVEQMYGSYETATKAQRHEE